MGEKANSDEISDQNHATQSKWEKMGKIFLFLAIVLVLEKSLACSFDRPTYSYTVTPENGKEYDIDIDEEGYTIVPEIGTVLYVARKESKAIKLDKDDIKTFTQTSFSRYYAKNKKHVYYKGKIIPDLNPDFAEYLGGIVDRSVILQEKDGYVKDNQTVFFKGVKIDQGDTMSFQLILFSNDDKLRYAVHGGYAKDKNNLYHNGKVMNGFDLHSFELVGYGYTKDKNGIYYRGEQLKGTNPEAFRVIPKFNDAAFLVSQGKVYDGNQLLAYDGYSFDEVFTYFEMPVCFGNGHYIGSMVKDKRDVYIYTDKEGLFSKRLYVRDPSSFKFEDFKHPQDKYQDYKIIYFSSVSKKRKVSDKLNFRLERVTLGDYK